MGEAIWGRSGGNMVSKVLIDEDRQSNNSRPQEFRKTLNIIRHLVEPVAIDYYFYTSAT
jgi:hypothetical protein